MSLPQAVQNQINEVDAFYAQGNTVTAAAQPDAATAGTPGVPAPELNVPDVQQNFEEKYRVLQGKYNAEVPRLQQQARDQAQTINELRAQLSVQPTTAALPQASVPDLVAQIAETAGSPALAKTILALIQAETTNAVKPVAQQVSQVNQQVAQVNQSVQQATVDPNLETLRGLVNGLGIKFDMVDQDPMFRDWLHEVDPATGAQRSAAFRYNLHTLKDMKAVSEFYLRFVRDPRWSVAPAPAAPTQNAPNLNLQVTVPGTAVAPGAQQVVVPTWTEQSIKEFYERKRRGMYPPAEAARLEAEIMAFAAQ